MATTNSIDILNTIRMNASTEYQDRIPQATRDNISSIGNALSTYQPLYNEFCEALVNKIGKTLIEQKMFKNRLARFKSGEIVNAKDVEEIFIEMCKAEGAYDPEGKNPLGRREENDVHVVYHRQNRRDYYAVTVGDIDFRRVFSSVANLDAFIKAKINSVYAADQRDEWIAMKNLFAEAVKNDQHPAVYITKNLGPKVTGEEFAKCFIKTLRKAVQDVSFLSRDYNVAGVETFSNPEDLVLLVNKDVLVEVDVELLARAFNTSHTDMKVVPTIIAMDDFGNDGDLGVLEHVGAMLIDKDYFRVWDTLSHMEPQRNAQGLFTNWFYHHHQILSLSPFKTAVQIILEDVE